MYKDENIHSICPNCHIGRVQQTQRPYLELYQGHLFTIPSAMCYVCDLCEYTEFDEATIELVNNVVFKLASPSQHNERDEGHIHSPKSDDEVPTKPIRPQLP